jgi:hypothetical protein
MEISWARGSERTLAIGAGQGLRGRCGSGGLGRVRSVWGRFGDAAQGDLKAEGSELADVVGDLAAHIALALIRSHPYGHPDSFRSVRDLGRIAAGCPWKSGESRCRSSVWLPAWLAAVLDPWRVGARNRTRTVSLGICAGWAVMRVTCNADCP